MQRTYWSYFVCLQQFQIHCHELDSCDVFLASSLMLPWPQERASIGLNVTCQYSTQPDGSMSKQNNFIAWENQTWCKNLKNFNVFSFWILANANALCLLFGSIHLGNSVLLFKRSFFKLIFVIVHLMKTKNWFRALPKQELPLKTGIH